MLTDISAVSPFKITRYSNINNELHLELQSSNSYHVFMIKPAEKYDDNFIKYNFTHNIYFNGLLTSSQDKLFVVGKVFTLGFFLDNIPIEDSMNVIHELNVIHDTFISGNRCEYVKNNKIITKSHLKWAFLLSDNQLLEMGIEYDDTIDTFATA